MEELEEIAIKRRKAALEDLCISEAFIDCIAEVYGYTNKTHRNLGNSSPERLTRVSESSSAKKPVRELVRTCGDFSVDLIACSLDIKI